MKKKFLILTLCFTLVFSSFNYKRSYADGGVISLPMLGVVSALAVGSGIVLHNNDDLYDLGRFFHDWVDRQNDLTWETVNAVFLASSSIVGNKVSVRSDFLDIVKGFFDDTFSEDAKYIGSYYDIPVYPNYLTVDNQDLYVGSHFYLKHNVDKYGHEYTSYWNGSARSSLVANSSKGVIELYISEDLNHISWRVKGASSGSYCVQNAFLSDSVIGFPYNGGYVWDNVGSRENDDSVIMPIPGQLGDLVGQGSDSFWDNSLGLVGQGGLTLPGVDNPSIDVDTSVNTFPGVDSPDIDVPGVDSPSVPNDGIWATIKEFIIGLVVPSDTYWTDTWGGLYNNFTSSFPMVDMDGFNDLVTGEKKFPNIDIDIMGVNGRVVNGDVVNSIVDWLRPIIAGFMMLCLMLFNYRKIYKLIRNTEPFGGIAPGTSDFKTGISEYNKEPVIKAVDMASEYRTWKENGGM